LTVNYFQTEPCCDILSVYDGADANSPSLANLSGDYVQGKTYVSTTNRLFLQFTTDFINQEQGFSIAYRAMPATAEERISNDHL
jgi:hypothetical protein